MEWGFEREMGDGDKRKGHVRKGLMEMDRYG